MFLCKFSCRVSTIFFSRSCLEWFFVLFLNQMFGKHVRLRTKLHLWDFVMLWFNVLTNLSKSERPQPRASLVKVVLLVNWLSKTSYTVPEAKPNSQSEVRVGIQSDKSKGRETFYFQLPRSQRLTGWTVAQQDVCTQSRNAANFSRQLFCTLDV